MEAKKTFGVHYAWLAMIACCCMMAGSMGIFVNCNSLFLKPIAGDLGVGLASVTLFMSIGTLTKSFGMPFAERIMAKFGWRKVCCLGSIGLCLAWGSLSVAPSLAFIYAAAVIYGLCNTVLNFMSIPIILNTWFKKKAGTAIGIAMACSGFGGLVFNPLAGALIETMGWNTAMMTMAAIAFVIMVPTTFFFLKTPEEKGIEPYGAQEAAAEEAARAGSEAAAEPVKGVTRAQALKSPSFWSFFFFGGMLCLYIAFSTNLAPYLASVGVETFVAATVISAQMFGMIVGKIATGWVNDHWGPMVACVFCTIIGAVALLLFAFFSSQIAACYVAGALFGASMANYNLLPALFCKPVFGMKHYGEIYSLIQTGCALVGAFSATVYALIYDITGTYSMAVWLCLTVLCIATVLAFVGMVTGKKLKALQK